jgi:hypothetical protein
MPCFPMVLFKPCIISFLFNFYPRDLFVSFSLLYIYIYYFCEKARNVREDNYPT